MSASAPMQSVGMWSGQNWYWADGNFEHPGPYYWNGSNNVHAGDRIADLEADNARLREDDALHRDQFAEKDRHINRLLAELAAARAVIEDIAADKTLRTRRACYHARRVALTCGAFLAKANGMYTRESAEAARKGG